MALCSGMREIRAATSSMLFSTGRRAGEPVAKEPILEEWKAIAARLLAEP